MDESKIGLNCNFLCAYLSDCLPEKWKDGEDVFTMFKPMTESISYPSPTVMIEIRKEAFEYIKANT